MDQNPIAEAAKAVAETSGKALDLVIGLGRIVKPPADELAGILCDRLKFVRWKGQVALFEKSQRIMAERRLSRATRELPLNFAIPLLTHAFLEEDDELQEAWARLLVNAGDASTEMELRVAYISILNGMSAFDVKNLSLMARASLDAPEKGYLPVLETWDLPSSTRVHEETSQNTGKISKELGISLGNLNRLGCAAPAYGFGGMAIFQLMSVTHLGRALYLACS
ncbi:MAG TPA: Abi-alpha family protein [Terriglobales bacterium]|nr:Abi-alpha family protein [Terriglobales bacterium]HXR16438.1 Abi-alpha family protein [Terriglobales bacterium]